MYSILRGCVCVWLCSGFHIEYNTTFSMIFCYCLLGTKYKEKQYKIIIHKYKISTHTDYYTQREGRKRENVSHKHNEIIQTNNIDHFT